MYEQVNKPKENKSRAVGGSVAQKKSNVKQGFGFVDNRKQKNPPLILNDYPKKSGVGSISSNETVVQRALDGSEQQGDNVIDKKKFMYRIVSNDGVSIVLQNLMSPKDDPFTVTVGDPIAKGLTIAKPAAPQEKTPIPAAPQNVAPKKSDKVAPKLAIEKAPPLLDWTQAIVKSNVPNCTLGALSSFASVNKSSGLVETVYFDFNITTQHGQVVSLSIHVHPTTGKMHIKPAGIQLEGGGQDIPKWILKSLGKTTVSLLDEAKKLKQAKEAGAAKATKK